MGSYHRGNVTILDPEAATREFDSFQCKHCNAIIIIQPSKSERVWSPPQEIARIGLPPPPRATGERQRGFCFRCMGPTCGKRGCVPCVPFEKRLEEVEGSQRLWGRA